MGWGWRWGGDGVKVRWDGMEVKWGWVEVRWRWGGDEVGMGTLSRVPV